MNEYFATCDVQGPISVKIMANSLEKVLEQIRVHGLRWINDSRSDFEDAYIDSEWDDNWDNYSPENIRAVMQDVGYQCVHDSNIEGYWIVWEKV